MVGKRTDLSWPAAAAGGWKPGGEGEREGGLEGGMASSSKSLTEA